MKTMLEYQKMILEKVSFDKRIFKKELVKSAKWLIPDEFFQLIEWVRQKFGPSYSEAISLALPIGKENKKGRGKFTNPNPHK